MSETGPPPDASHSEPPPAVPEAAPAPPERPHLLDLAGLLTAGLILFGLGLNLTDLWSPDEPRYARIAHEMRTLGDWLVPRLNGAFYSEKPPLYFWLAAGCEELAGGPSSLTARIPSAVAAVLTMLLVYVLGCRWRGRNVGLVAAAIFATASGVLIMGRRSNLDMLLTFFTTGTIAAGAAALDTARGSAWNWLLAGLCTGLGLLTKGPVALLIPAIALVPYALAVRRGQWQTVALPGGVALAVAMAAGWLIPACATGGWEYTEALLWRQLVTRTTEAWTHRQPFFYFLYAFPPQALPWIFLLPTGLLLAWRARRQEPAAALALVWFVGLFVFFSIPATKRETYLLPAMPAFALLCAPVVLQGAGAPGRGRWEVGIAGGLVIFAGMALALAPTSLAQDWLQGHKAWAEWGHLAPRIAGGLLGTGLMGLAAGIACLAMAQSGRTVHGFAALSAGIVAGTLWAAVHLLPGLNDALSARPFSERIAGAVDRNTTLMQYDFFEAGFLLYMDRNMGVVGDEPEEVARLRGVWGAPQRTFILTTEGDLASLRKKAPGLELHVWQQARVGHRRLLLVGNRPPPGH